MYTPDDEVLQVLAENLHVDTVAPRLRTVADQTPKLNGPATPVVRVTEHGPP